MHTVNALKYEDFDFEMNDHQATLEDILPGYHPHDRIGIVVRRTGGGIGASALMMSALTRFYDFYRPNLGVKPGQLFIYPEFFVFHVGERHMNHTWMDIWPPHREVDVEDDPEQILEAINDRGITRLLVEDIPPTTNPIFLRETLSSAKSRLVSAFAYSPTGRVEQPNIKITSCRLAEFNVLKSVDRSDELSHEEKERLRQSREHLQVNGRVVETYRKIDIHTALNMLTPNTKPGETTRKYMKQIGLSV